jgi:hypothetical protein
LVFEGAAYAEAGVGDGGGAGGRGDDYGVSSTFGRQHN